MAASGHSPVNESETRQALLNAATELFAERGFGEVSVREICAKAGVANVAAVNYYFRDKAGLYRELLESLVARWVESRQQHAASLQGKAPEEKLHLYLRWLLGNILGENEDEKEVLFGKILRREMVEPTPELSIVIEKGMRPNFQGLAEIVGELLELPPDNCIVLSGTMGAMGHCLIYGSARKMAKYFMPPNIEFTSAVIDDIARHVTAFSLAGIRAMAAEIQCRPATPNSENAITEELDTYSSGRDADESGRQE